MNYIIYYNIYLLLLLIVLIYYYIYNKINIEKFENNGCFYLQQYTTNIDSRDCEVYLSKDGEDFCNKYKEYYEKSILELDDILIKLGKSNRRDDIDFKNSILKIREDIINNNINTCKVNYDGWKEIKTYNDKNSSSTSSNNLIYPHKNIYKTPDNITNKLTNICFRNSSNTDINIFENKNESITTSCNDIKNIYDNTTGIKEHKVIRFENYNKENLLNPICLNKKEKILDLDINEKNIYLSIIANYDKTKRELKTENISFVKYNKNNTFINADHSDNINIYNRLFQQIYNNNSIMYGPKENNVNSKLIKYDICDNIDNLLTKNSKINLKDFNINNIKLLNIDYTKYKELIELLNKNDIEYSVEDIKRIVNDLYNKNENYIQELKDKHKTYNDKIYKLLDIGTSTKVDTTLLSDNYSIYLNTINEAQIKTNDAINKLINKIFEVKEYIDKNYNIIKYEKNINNNFDDDVSKLTKYVNNANNECINLSRLYNNALNEEKTITENALININKMSIELIENNFYNGLYYRIGIHNKDIFTYKTPQNKLDFTSMYLNNKPDSHKKGLINYSNNQNDIISYDNKYKNDNIYTVIELDSNVKFETGYYIFYIDLLNEEASEVYLGYNDKSKGTPNIVFKNIANYYYNYSKHPKDRLRIPYGEGPAKINNEYNMTTKYPIYIDGSVNGGYYGFYKRNVRHIGNIYSKLMNVSYSKVSSQQLKELYGNKSYNIINDDNFEYIRYIDLNNEIKNYKVDLISQLYINKNISEPSNFTLTDKYLKDTYKEENTKIDYSYTDFKNDKEYLIAWWKLDGNLNDSIGDNHLILNNNLKDKSLKPYIFDNKDKKSGDSSLKLTNNNKDLPDYLLQSPYIKGFFEANSEIDKTLTIWIKIKENNNIVNLLSISPIIRLIIIGNKLYYHNNHNLNDKQLQKVSLDYRCTYLKSININNKINDTHNVSGKYNNGTTGTHKVTSEGTYTETYNNQDKNEKICNEYIEKLINDTKNNNKIYTYYQDNKQYIIKDGKNINIGYYDTSNITNDIEIYEYKEGLDLTKYIDKWLLFSFITSASPESTKILIENGNKKRYSPNLPITSFYINDKLIDTYNYVNISYISLYGNFIKNMEYDVSNTILFNDMRMYKKMLNINELRSLCNINKDTFKNNLKNLKYWWRFNNNLNDTINNKKFIINKLTHDFYYFNYFTNDYNVEKLLLTYNNGNEGDKHLLNSDIDIPDNFSISLNIKVYTQHSNITNKNTEQILKIGDNIKLGITKYSIYLEDISNIFYKNINKVIGTTTDHNSSSTTSFFDVHYNYKTIPSSSSTIGKCFNNGIKGDLIKSSVNNYKGGIGNNITTGTNTQKTYYCFENTQLTEPEIPYKIYGTNHICISYDKNNNLIYLYVNGKLYIKQKFIFKNTNQLGLFYKNTGDTHGISDLRVYDRLLTPEEIIELYGGDINESINIVRETNIIKDTDTRLIKTNDGYLINCPNMPSLNNIEKYDLISYDFKYFTIPNIPKYNLRSLIVIDNDMENLNLENFATLKEHLLYIKNNRNKALNINSYDCIIKNENTSIKRSVKDNDYSNIKNMIDNLNNEIDNNKNKQTDLMELLKDINNIKVYYDFNIIKKEFEKGIIINPKYYELFYEDRKTKKYNMLLEL